MTEHRTLDSIPPRTRPRPGDKLRAAAKVAKIPVKVESAERLAKPDWIRVRISDTPRVRELTGLLREMRLNTVCEEASCPNLAECFGHGTATFMIGGDICTRRCPFCDVASGRPLPLDEHEPARLADAVRRMALRYVVITAVDRDDLADGGAEHFARTVAAVRAARPGICVEVLVPDFKHKEALALDLLAASPPDVLNHNLETVPSLYRSVRPGADYAGSLQLLADAAERMPGVPTKSGLMLGLGEGNDEVVAVMRDLRRQGCSMLTLGQYLQPSSDHLPVRRFVHPDEFAELGRLGEEMGFAHVASGPLVRSSYHADEQARGLAKEGDT